MSTAATTVHLVDDDADVRTAVGRLLRAAGHRVEMAACGAEFLERPCGDGPACVLLDLAMPGMDGLAVQRQLSARADPRPVVFLTGEADVPSGVNAMKAGAVDFLTKPVDAEALLRCVAEALRRSASAHAQRAAVAAIARLAAELTGRENDVLRLVIAGLPNKRIAWQLGIAEKTVKIHRGRVMEKMHADSVADLVRLATAIGIAPADCTAPAAALRPQTGVYARA